jgi:hypothetical protein
MEIGHENEFETYRFHSFLVPQLSCTVYYIHLVRLVMKVGFSMTLHGKKET